MKLLVTDYDGTLLINEKDLEQLRDTYDSGVMMSLNESIDGKIACDDVLKKLSELEKNDNLSDLNKIARVRLYLEERDPDRKQFRYQIRDDIDGVINKYLPHKTRSLNMKNGH